jgi:glycosyltransferase involved in cell wall biosynthesis
LKISIITASYNSSKTIRETLESVANQTYEYIEHIIVDGASKDGTLEIIKNYHHVAKVISEPDNGIYDAMNKGIRVATGDVIGFLNSDDFLTSRESISKIADALNSNKVDAVFGDIKFVSAVDLGKVIRFYSSKKFNPSRFAWGYMPAHPTFYSYRKFYEKNGLFKTDYKICADYELLVRFLYSNKMSYNYIENVLVTMRAGGVSNGNLKSRYILNKEIVRACKENGINTNLVKVGLKDCRS